MIKIVKYRILTNTEYWFSENKDLKNNLGIVSFRQAKNDIIMKGYKKETFHTLISDLTASKEDILKNFSSTVRNEINRSIKEDVITVFNDSKSNFIPFYNNFASLKGLRILKKRSLSSYKRNLIITSAFSQNTQLCSHSYLIDYEIKRVRLLQSATMRFSEDIDHNLIGRANKYLHFQDMIYFKNQGYKIYDWGGIAANPTDSSLIGINRFKKSFGGEELIEYDYTSMLYEILLKVKKLLKETHF